MLYFQGGVCVFVWMFVMKGNRVACVIRVYAYNLGLTGLTLYDGPSMFVQKLRFHNGKQTKEILEDILGHPPLCTFVRIILCSHDGRALAF